MVSICAGVGGWIWVLAWPSARCLMTGVFLTLRAANWIVVESVAPLTSPSLWEVLVAPLVLSIVVAVSEELLARGDQTLNLSEGLRPLGRRQAVLCAWLLSSLSFGALHFFNPNSTWMSTAYLVIYGLLLGVGYILTGELAISIGLHFAWNYVQGAVFGFPVSGRSLAGVSILVTQERGPDLWTGGAFGPEAGLVAVLSALVGAALIALMGALALRARRALGNSTPICGVTSRGEACVACRTSFHEAHRGFTERHGARAVCLSVSLRANLRVAPSPICSAFSKGTT